MLFVWGFGSDTKPSKKNWARAMLIILVVVVVLYIILAVVFAAFFATLYSNLNTSSVS